MNETAVVTVVSYPRYADHAGFLRHKLQIESEAGVPAGELKEAKDTVRGHQFISLALTAGMEKMPVVVVDKGTNPDLMAQARRAYLFTEGNPRHWLHIREPGYVHSRARARFIGLQSLHASGIPFTGSLMVEPEKPDMLRNALPAIRRWEKAGIPAGVLGRFIDEFRLKYPPLQFATEQAMNQVANAVLHERRLLPMPDIDWLSGSRWNSRSVTSKMLFREPINRGQMDYAWYLFEPYFDLLKNGEPIGFERTKQHYHLLQDEMERRESTGMFLRYRLSQALPILSDIFTYFHLGERQKRKYKNMFFRSVVNDNDVREAIGSEGIRGINEFRRQFMQNERGIADFHITI